MLAKIESAIDQPNVAIGLRKIAQHAPRGGIELFGQQSDVVAMSEQTFEKPLRILVSTLQDVVVHQPKAASQERAFTRRNTIDALLRFITQHKLIIDEQPLLYRFESSANPRIVRRQEADDPGRTGAHDEQTRQTNIAAETKA
jgi:hypothetical protein